MIMMMRSVCLTTPRRHVKKKGKPHHGTVYTDQGKKRTLKSGSVAIMVQSRLRFTQLLQLHGPFLPM